MKCLNCKSLLKKADAQFCDLQCRKDHAHKIADANLMEYLGKHMDLTKRRGTSMDPVVKARTLSKTERVVQKGTFCTTAFWMELGYGRCFTKRIDNKGLSDERTIDFFTFNKILLFDDCFFNGKPSDYDVEIAKNSVIVPFSKAFFELLNVNLKEIGMLVGDVLVHERARGLERVNIQRMKPRERYPEFLRVFGPEIEQFFAIKHIASFLGMQPSYLSRLRAENIRKGDKPSN